MFKKYIIYPDKIFKGEEGAIISYPEDQKEPYELYKKKFEKGTVYVLVKSPGKIETNNKETTIELFDLGTPLDMRGTHFFLKLPSNGIKNIGNDVTFSTKDAIPKAGMFSKLWGSSPFSLVKSLSTIEEQMIKDGCIHQSEIPTIFDFGSIQSTMKVEEFLRKNNIFLK